MANQRTLVPNGERAKQKCGWGSMHTSKARQVNLNSTFHTQWEFKGLYIK